MALSHIKDGANNTQTARHLHIGRRIVNDWVKRFYEQGLDGLKEKSRSGRPCNLNKQQLSQLSQYIHDNSLNPKAEDSKHKHLLLILRKNLKSTIQLIIFIGFYIS
jgi:transposase